MDEAFRRRYRRDYEGGRQWAEEAAAQGKAAAMARLGDSITTRWASSASPESSPPIGGGAAASLGHAEAQVMLGAAHLAGLGVERDPVEALHWLLRAKPVARASWRSVSCARRVRMPRPRSVRKPNGARGYHCVIGLPRYANRDRSLIARLQADCTAAETAERSFGPASTRRSRLPRTARAFAWRRLNALTDMAKAAAAEPDPEAAIERQLVALFREIGWVETSPRRAGGRRAAPCRAAAAGRPGAARAGPSAPDGKEEKPAGESIR